MPSRKVPVSVPPTMSPAQAVPLLKRQIERLDAEIINLRSNDPKVGAWESTTESILDAVFGRPNGDLHKNTYDFKHETGSVGMYIGMGDAERERRKLSIQQHRRELLLAFVEQLQDLAPPATQTAPDNYRFHPEIERVSGQLYRDGHYKQAALEAYICVITAVRERSGLNEDGDRLMNRAFGCSNQTPLLQFNDLQTEAERDEQTGLMYLYKGIVGLRNSKAHSNRLFNDPSRAHEYLALGSLLLRLLEVARVNPSQP